MNKFTAALKATLDAHPSNGVPEFKDISSLMEEAFKTAGYELQLHQHGISGTSIIAVQILPEIIIEATEPKEVA